MTNTLYLSITESFKIQKMPLNVIIIEMITICEHLSNIKEAINS
jgi:hypothetical protein